MQKQPTYFSRVDAKRLQATDFSRGFVPICTRCTLVDLTPKYPTLVASSPAGARGPRYAKRTQFCLPSRVQGAASRHTQARRAARQLSFVISSSRGETRHLFLRPDSRNPLRISDLRGICFSFRYLSPLYISAVSHP